MSGHGAPTTEPVDCSDLRVAVVAASWHTEVMDGLLAGTQRALDAHGVAEHHLERFSGHAASNPGGELGLVVGMGQQQLCFLLGEHTTGSTQSLRGLRQQRGQVGDVHDRSAASAARRYRAATSS